MAEPKKGLCKAESLRSSAPRPSKRRAPAGLEKSEMKSPTKRSTTDTQPLESARPLSRRDLRHPYKGPSQNNEMNSVDAFLYNLSRLTFSQIESEPQLRQPVEIFGDNALLRFPDTSIEMNAGELPVRPATRKTHTPNPTLCSEMTVLRAEKNLETRTKDHSSGSDCLNKSAKHPHRNVSLMEQGSSETKDLNLMDIIAEAPPAIDGMRRPSRTVYPIEYLKSLDRKASNVEGLRSEKIETKSSSIPEGRRRVSLTDRALRSFKSLERDSGDAGDLDLENKIRLSHRARRPRQNANVKSVSWDPAIVLCGPQSSPPATMSKPTVQKDHNIELKDCLNDILSLKRNDRHKLRELLNALSKIDGDSVQVEKGAASEGKGLLNPKAPTFQTMSTFRNHSRTENSIDQKTWPPVGSQATPDATSQSIWIRTSSVVYHPPVQTKTSSGIQIDDENAHGREARSIDPVWANSLLHKFSARYPLTGKLKAAPPSAAKGRLAAVIQQRLEYLLLREKEKKAFEGKENVRF